MRTRVRNIDLEIYLHFLDFGGVRAVVPSKLEGNIYIARFETGLIFNFDTVVRGALQMGLNPGRSPKNVQAGRRVRCVMT